MLKSEMEKLEMENDIQFLMKLDIARLSRAAGLVEKVLETLTEVDIDHIAVPIKLYCSKYEIQTVKNILERIINGYTKKNKRRG